MVRRSRKVGNQIPGSETCSISTRDWCVSWRRAPERTSRRKTCGASYPARDGPRSMNAMVRPSGLAAHRNSPRTECTRLGGPSRRSPLPSARTKKMPSSGSWGVSAGRSENCLVTSKTTPEPSGSTAMAWKTPTVGRKPPSTNVEPWRKAPIWRHSLKLGTGVDGPSSMTATGSQFPRRTRSFCFSELRPCGSVVHSLTT
jgi:hypothetical protein